MTAMQPHMPQAVDERGTATESEKGCRCSPLGNPYVTCITAHTQGGWRPHLHALLCVATWTNDEADEVVARVLVLWDVHLVAVLARPAGSTQQYIST